MSDLYFKAFRPSNPEDVFNWDRYILYWQLQDHLTEVDRDATIKAVSILQMELRNEFLKNMQGKNHPISYHVHNKAENSRSWIIWLGHWLTYFKQRECNYNKLLKSLIPYKTSETEGIPLLEIGSAYANAGFEVVFQPEVKSTKKPDVEIINPLTKEKFYIDVAFLKNRDQNENISIKYQILFNQLHFKAPFLNFSCKQLLEIPDKDLENVLNVIKEAKEKAQNEESFLIMKENKYIELAIAHSSKHAELDLWCKERDDRHQDLIGLTLNFDETPRIRKKIKTKGKQIADAGYGLVYIPVHPLYFLIKDPGCMIAEIESKINECPALLGAVIYSKIGHTAEKEIVIKDFHVYTKKMRFPHIQEDLIFVANEKCTANISEETISRIYNTF